MPLTGLYNRVSQLTSTTIGWSQSQPQAVNQQQSLANKSIFTSTLHPASDADLKRFLLDNPDLSLDDLLSMDINNVKESYTSIREEAAVISERLEAIASEDNNWRHPQVLTTRTGKKELDSLQALLQEADRNINRLQKKYKHSAANSALTHLRLSAEMERKRNELYNLTSQLNASQYSSQPELHRGCSRQTKDLSRSITTLVEQQDNITNAKTTANQCLLALSAQYQRIKGLADENEASRPRLIVEQNHSVITSEANVYTNLIKNYKKQIQAINTALKNIDHRQGKPLSESVLEHFPQLSTTNDPYSYLTKAKKQIKNESNYIKNRLLFTQKHLTTPFISDHRLGSNTTSKYGQVQNITFSVGTYLEPTFTSASACAAEHYTQKGAAVSQQHNVDIHQVKGLVIDPSIKESLDTIPIDEAAANPEIKHTKVRLYLHGERSHTLSAKDPHNITHKVLATDMAHYIAAHLRKGDYRGKLTLALSSCYGAYKRNNDDLSSLEQIAATLKNAGYTGIKLTGVDSKATTSLQSQTNIEATMGSVLVLNSTSRENFKQRTITGDATKLSQSSNKEIIHI